MVKVVSVKFKGGSKIYYFAPGKDKYEKGMGVVVETAKGLEYATVVTPECEVEEGEIVSPLKPVVRVATPKDEEQIKRNEERRGEALATAQEKITARGLEMKLVDCEFAFDGSKVTFFFTADNRVDFRELIKDLSAAFHMRIELRQIGIRDEIKMLGGFGPCGRECCCISCMAEPQRVSVKMAKNQGLSLNPTKISGMCGKLMCCLSYENEYYADVCKRVPKLGSEVETPNGKGIVVNVNMLKMEVKVKIEERDAVSYHDFGVDEIRFMRGNVMMGREEEFGDDDDELPDEEPDIKPNAATRTEEPRSEEPRHGDGHRPHGKKNKDNRNRDGKGGAKEGAEGKPAPRPQEDAPRPQGGTPRHNGQGGKHKKKHGGKGGNPQVGKPQNNG